MSLIPALTDFLSSAFPVRSAEFAIQVVAEPEPARLGSDGEVVVTLRLVVFDDDGGVTNIKEQPIRLVPATHVADVPRAMAYARAWAAELRSTTPWWDVEALMPNDLVFAELLDDPELVGESAFAAAFADDARRTAIQDAREDADLLSSIERTLGEGDPRVAAVLALVRPSIEIVSEDLELGECPLGASRLGGRPDLPPELAWPCDGDQPLSFLAQFDLAEVHAAAGEAAGALPDRGWLAFFFLLEGASWEADKGGARVLYFSGPRDDLTRRAPPPSVEELRCRSVEFVVRRHALPQLDSPFYRLITGAASSAEDATFEGLSWYMYNPFWYARIDDEEAPRDRLLGFSDVLQSDPYVACAAREGRVPIDQIHSRETVERAARLTLLFQADSTRDVSYGDAGLVQFFLDAEDLAARRFERVCAEFQCH